MSNEHCCPRCSARISALERRLAQMTDERDTESRFAKYYHNEAKELRKQLTEARDQIRFYRQEFCDEE
jgi:hypothetical protein